VLDRSTAEGESKDRSIIKLRKMMEAIKEWADDMRLDRMVDLNGAHSLYFVLI
jgi:hypothetical protein